MKKTLIQLGIVAGMILVPYSVAGPKVKEVTDHQRIENLIETAQKLTDLVNEQQGYIQVLWARTEDLHDSILKLQGDPANTQKASYKALAELNDLDARVSQLERPEVEDDAK